MATFEAWMGPLAHQSILWNNRPTAMEWRQRILYKVLVEDQIIPLDLCNLRKGETNQLHLKYRSHALKGCQQHNQRKYTDREENNAFRKKKW